MEFGVSTLRRLVSNCVGAHRYMCEGYRCARTTPSHMFTQDKFAAHVFACACERMRKSVNQSEDSIIADARRRLIRNPDELPSLHVVAASHLCKGKSDQCLSLLVSHASLANDPVGNQIAAYACVANGHTETAREYFERSVKLDPCNVDCWNWLGSIAEQDNDDAWAARYYQRAMIIGDNQHESAVSLARVHAKNHRLSEAIHTLRVCLFRDPRSARLNVALARLLIRRAGVRKKRKQFLAQRRSLAQAIDCLKIANASSPTIKSLMLQGAIQKRIGACKQASETYREAVRRDPENAIAIALLADVLVECGDISSAVAHYRKSIRLDPSNARVHFNFARAHRFQKCRETRKYLKLLSAQLKSPTPTDRQRVYLHFALAKTYEDIKRYDRAWRHYDFANRYKPCHSQTLSTKRIEATQRLSESPEYKPLQQLTDCSIQYLGQQYFQSRVGCGDTSDQPIFIVGMPRSGTTLTEQILSSHPMISGAGELPTIDQIKQQMCRQHARECTSLDSTTQRDAYPQILASVCDATLGDLSQRYLSVLDEHRGEASRVTDKMPTNFMHLGLIASMFPNATIIHCRRNPMDVFVSSYCQNLAKPFCDLQQLVHYYHNYRRLMSHWEQVLPVKIHTVDYEAMVADPERHSRALVAHCGLEWSERCLSFHKNDRSVHTPSKVQVRQPMYSTSVEKWRRYEKHLRPIVSELRQITAAFSV